MSHNTLGARTSWAVVRLPLAVLLFAAAQLLLGGTIQAQTSTVTVTGFNPTLVSVGDPSFTLQVVGTGFATGDVVLLAGTALDTTFVSSTLLTATVSSGSLGGPATFQVAVKDTNGVVTQSSTGTGLVVQAKPTTVTTTSINPIFVTQGATGVQVVITGTGLTSSSKVLISGKDAGTVGTQSLNGATALTITVNSDTTAVIGLMTVQAVNSDSTNGTVTSNAQILNVGVNNIPTPTITSISPSTVGAGTPTFTLVIVGTNFVTGARVLLADNALPVTFFSPVEIHATLDKSLFRTAGTLSIIVENPGSIDSAPASLTVTAPVFAITNIAPTLLFAGGSTTEVAIFGNNIPVASTTATPPTVAATVTLNGVAVTPKTIDQDHIVVELMATDIASPGTLTFQVTNPGDTTGTVVPPLTVQVVPQPLVVTTFAGSRFLGLVDGPLKSAHFSRPSRMAESPVDHSLWIADQFNHAVRRIATNPADPFFNQVITIAGNGKSNGVDSLGNVTQDFITLATSQVDSAGNALTLNPQIKVTPSSDPTKNPVTMSNPVGLAIDNNGVVYVTELGNNIIRRISPQADGSYIVDVYAGLVVQATDSTGKPLPALTPLGGFFDGPALAAFDPKSTTPVTTTTTVASAAFLHPDGIAIGLDGTIYVADGFNFRVRRIRNVGGVVTVDTFAGGLPGDTDGNGSNAQFNQLAGLDFAPDHTNLYVSDPLNLAVRQVNTVTADVTTVTMAGTVQADGAPTVATFGAPTATATTHDGKLLVADSRGNNAIRWVQPDESLVTFAGQNFGTVVINTVTVTAPGGFADGPALGPIATAAQFNTPRSVFVASNGTIYVVDSGNNLIRIIGPPAGGSTKTNKAKPMPATPITHTPIRSGPKLQRK